MERRNSRWAMVACALVWLVVLIVPELRAMCLAQLRDGDAFRSAKSKNGQFAALPFGVNEWLNKIAPREIDYQRLARQHPGDARFQLVAADADIHQKWSAFSDEQTVWRGGVSAAQVYGLEKYDRISYQFPRDASILAARLRLTLTGQIEQRSVGELAKPGRENTSTRFLPTRAQLESAVAAARQGQSVEPDNCFFDLVLSDLLLALHRDDEALRVLHGGAQKPRYDDHVLDFLRVKLAVAASAHRLSVEDKANIVSLMSLPHFARHRNFARVAVWLGMLSERAGNHARALQIYGDVARIGARMRDSQDLYITALVGIALQNEAWQHNPKIPPTGPGASDDPTPIYQHTAQGFAAYAREHNRLDLANEAMRDAKLDAELVKQGRDYFQGPFPLGVLLSDSTLTKLWWLATALLGQCLCMLSAWLLLTLAMRNQKGFAPARALNVAIVVFCIATFCAALLGFAWAIGAEANPYASGQSEAGMNSTFVALRYELNLAPLVLGAFLCFISAFLCFISAAWREHKAYSRKLREAELETKKKPVELPIRVRRLVIGGAIIGIILFALISSPNLFIVISVSVLVLSLPAIFVVKSVVFALRFFHSTRHHSFFSTRSERQLHASLGALFVVSSVAYLVLSLASLPSRRAVETHIDRQIAQGEMKLVRQMQASKSTPE